MDSQTPVFRILLFPWLAHGHIFPYLEFCKRLLTRKKFHIYLCSTAVNFSSIKNFIRANNLDHSIELVEVHLDPSPQLSPHNYTTKNLPLQLNHTLIKHFQTAKSSFSDIITNLKPDLVIYDGFQPWAPRHALSQGIPAVHFFVMGAAGRSYVHHQYICWNDKFPFPELCPRDHERKSLDSLQEFMYTDVFEEDKDIAFVNLRLSSEFVLLKTSRAFEGKYLDYVSGVCNKKILPVGPLVTDVSTDEDNSDILQWLSKKDHHSTVYISFGSEHFLSKKEIEEIAKGLELCKVNFIWVIRFPLEENTITTEEILPKGFLDRVEDRGIVVTGWAPQAKILAHPSTGAFMSHCGWSSVMESLYFGVPVIGMPEKINMFIDANLLADAGAGVRIPVKENEVYKGEDIAEVINEVIVGKSGEGLRHAAQELSEKMRMEEAQEMDAVAEHVWQICMKNKLKEKDSKITSICD